MTPAERTEYIVGCIREGAAMYPDDAEKFLAEHDAEVRAGVQADPTAQKPDRFTAYPVDVQAFLAEHFAEDVILRYQQAIGSYATEEAARDIRMETNRLHGHGVLEPDKYRPCRDAADQIDPIKGGGPYPSELIRFSRTASTGAGESSC